jgi:ribosomal silencing factor RsfS
MGFGMILVSASDRRLLRNVAENLVLLLRQRNLHQVGVVGAEAGVEGQSDHYQDSNWLVVDCGNYVVHLQDELTRKAVNLEGLWTGKDGLHRLNLLDDNAVEDYVANNPVPEDYHWASSGGSTDVDETIKQLQRSRWTIPHQPVVRKPKRKRGRRR